MLGLLILPAISLPLLSFQVTFSCEFCPYLGGLRTASLPAPMSFCHQVLGCLESSPSWGVRLANLAGVVPCSAELLQADLGGSGSGLAPAAVGSSSHEISSFSEVSGVVNCSLIYEDDFWRGCYLAENKEHLYSYLISMR